ncbi:MAG: CoA transferase [Proteobacteria bacterium]|nr:CoA transferase [Pseudomonadota bacterium]
MDCRSGSGATGRLGVNRLLRQISVLDMTEGVAGPCAASLLGDMGASVIKVERPEGDWGRGSEDPLRPYFVANNKNKRCSGVTPCG